MNKYGYIPDQITPDNWVAGVNSKIAAEPVNPTGDWTPFVPDFDPQSKNGVETFSCTSYGTVHMIEMLEFFLTGAKSNYAERFPAILSGTTKQGNSEQTVCETIRTKGLIPADMLPFSDDITSWEQYMNPNAITPAMLSAGQAWLAKWQFNHHWLFQSADYGDLKTIIHNALFFSPVGVGVYAWEQDPVTGYYIFPKGATANHWVAGIVVNMTDKYYEIFDSYEGDIKKLDINYPFAFAKGISLTRLPDTPPTPAQISILSQILSKISQVVSLLSQWAYQKTQGTKLGKFMWIEEQLPKESKGRDQ